jgi:CheY-like chemotaxis protein/outer membrane biosynthesis protein TonB
MGMKKILIIDYDQTSLASLSATLSNEGFEVVTAGDGQVGWEKFQSEKPDLVLMEAMLSKIHGFELCDRITKNPARKVPVFIMTGVYKDRVYRTEALRTYGASEYFEKPLDMLKFIASIHAVLTVPDIKPDPDIRPAIEVKPGNGEPAEEPVPLPVVHPVLEEPLHVEPHPEVKHPRETPPRMRPGYDAGLAGGEGLSLESVLQIKPGREESHRAEAIPGLGSAKATPPKVKIAPDRAPTKGEEIRLETLLNLVPEKEDHHRTEPPRPKAQGHAVTAAVEEKPREHAKKEAGTEDIDRLLKTTLADFGLETEKKKTVRAALRPAPKAEPVAEKPKAAAPAAPAPAAQKTKYTPQSVPPPAVHEPAKPATPPPMPSAVAEKPKAPQPKPATPPPPPAQAYAKSKPAAPPAPAVHAAPAPKPEARPEPRPAAEKSAKKEPAWEPDKAAESRIFKDIYEVEKKKNPMPFVAVGAGLVIVAAVGFFILKPKHSAAPAGPGGDNQATMTQSTVPEKSPETSLPPLPEEKLKAVNPKPKAAPATQNRQAEALPTAEELIVPPQPDASRLAIQVPAEKKPEAKPTGTKTAEVKPGNEKAAEAQTSPPQDRPPMKTEAAPPQGTPAGGNDAASQPAPAPKANTGDLIDLAAVDEEPRTIKTFEPVYPSQAAHFGKEGTVTVNALISEAGNVIKKGILKGLKDDMARPQPGPPVFSTVHLVDDGHIMFGQSVKRGNPRGP